MKQLVFKLQKKKQLKQYFFKIVKLVTLPSLYISHLFYGKKCSKGTTTKRNQHQYNKGSNNDTISTYCDEVEEIKKASKRIFNKILAIIRQLYFVKSAAIKK